MQLLIWSSIFAALVAVSLVRAVRQARHYENLPASCAVGTSDLPSIAAIIPMRNESNNIDTCLSGLMAQDYPRERLSIIVVDDNSADDSAALVRRYIGDGRVALIQAGTLPEGWAGKPHACWQGALAARAEWLCFLDADTLAAPALFKSAIATARQRKLDMLSLAPFQELSFFFDRLLIPFGFLSIAATQDLARVNDAACAEATANGQCILIRGRCYFEIGGHAAVRREICEDRALARRIKAAHRRFALMGAERLICTHMYRNLAELWEGLSKNITEVYGGRTTTAIVAAAAVFIGASALLLPAATFGPFIREPTPWTAAAAGSTLAADCAFLATTIALARRCRIAWWYGLLAPLASVLGAAIAVNGILLRTRRRVAWKGRIYAFSPEDEASMAAPVDALRRRR